MTALEELLAKLKANPELKQKALELVKNNKMIWVPNPGPQTDAFNSKADIMLYGGQPGGGKSALLLGLALTRHRRSLVIRKQFSDLDGIVDNLQGIIKTKQGIARGGRPKYQSPDGRLISFQGVADTGEVDTGKQGNAFDLIAVDEAAQLSQSVIRTMIGWNRPGPGVDKDQRCRVVLASNPPLNSTGDWLGEFFGAWFDDKHPNPAKFGELRWYYFDDEGKSVETLETKPFEIDGSKYYPHSRTYIAASLRDNPFLSEDDYQKNLQAFEEPLRSIIMSGNFLAARQDQDFQVIPTQWVRDAMERWKQNPNPPEGVPMCAMGCDMVMGGKDDAIIAPRYDYWFDKFVAIPGKDVPDGNLGGHIIMNRKDNAIVIIDMGGGYGGATWNCLKENLGTLYLRGYKGGDSGVGRTKDKQLGFFNKRSADYWKLREALDPSQLGGSCICLPPDPLLLADLTAPTFEITNRGIRVQSKQDTNKEGEVIGGIRKKLGRSPDRGDSVVMSNAEGVRGLTPLNNRSVDLKRISMPTHAKMSERKLTLR